MDTQKPHVAILPSPGIGHIFPLLELAKQLVTVHEFQVSFFVCKTHASAAQSQLLRSAALPDGLTIIQLPAADVSGLIPDGAGIETRMSIIVRESVPSLRAALTETARPTVLLVDIFGTDTFDMADELHMPKYVFFTSTAMLLALMMYLPTLDKEVEGEYIHLQEPLQIPGCKPLQLDNIVDPLRDRTTDRYKWMVYQSSRFPMAEGILVNTCEALEAKTFRALREEPGLKQIPTPVVYPVGPIVRLETPAGLGGRECLEWLERQPPESVLYVSFGSGGTLSAEQLTELAWGLEMSQQRFLWVVRPPSETEKSGTYFTSGGQCGEPSDYLPDGFLSRTEGISMVVPSWVPQIEILRHAAIGGFLTHCGLNSSLESILCGVPMIAWPLFAEQRMNSSMLTEEVKVAVGPLGSPGKGCVRREEIERAVRGVMGGEQGEGLRVRVKRLRDDALRGLEEGGLSHTSLSRVVNEWKTALGGGGIVPETERDAFQTNLL